MALNPTTLAALIKSKRVAALGDALASGEAASEALDADCQAIAEAVIEHIAALAVVTVPPGVAVQVAPATGTGATIAPAVGGIT